MRIRALQLTGIAFVTALLLTSCAPEPGTEVPASEAVSNESEAAEPTEDAEETPAPVEQADSCDWDSPKISGDPAPPSGQDGDLQSTIVGAWQHTHYDEGGGWESMNQDIRYVFASSDQILYCQHVPDVTDHAENRADISWESARIVLPDPAPGYTVQSWDADTMVWVNHFDDSLYLLQRR